MNAACPPVFCASAMTCSARVVFPPDSGPNTSTTRPRGKPPTPSAASIESAPVEITLTGTITSLLPSRMIEPLPYCFSICAMADSSILVFSSVMVAPREEEFLLGDVGSQHAVYQRVSAAARLFNMAILVQRRRKSKYFSPAPSPLGQKTRRTGQALPHKRLGRDGGGTAFLCIGVEVKPPARLAPQPPRRNHLAQQRAGAVLRIGEARVEHFHDVGADVQADQVSQLQRPHRVVHSQLHHRVHRLGRG